MIVAEIAAKYGKSSVNVFGDTGFSDIEVMVNSARDNGIVTASTYLTTTQALDLIEALTKAIRLAAA